MLFIGICGASGSGKSTLAKELSDAIGESCYVINQDAYYLDHGHLSFEERTHLNYDKPDIFDHQLLKKDIETLFRGEAITKKGYDYALHRRHDTADLIMPCDVMILEGIHSFFDQPLCDMMFLKLYISVEPDICLLRRIRRDIKERERDIDSISAQYLATVKPMYDRYVRGYIDKADVIVAKGGKNARIVDILAGYVRDELQSR